MAIPNPYQQIAEYKAQPAPRKQWTVLDVMDYEDVIGRNDESLTRRAKALFASLEKNPHTRFIDAAMATPSDGLPVDTPQAGIVALVGKSDKKLTHRQEEAMQAYDEAIHQDLPPVMYVAKKLGIHKSNASRIIKRAKIATFGENKALISSVDTPTQAEVDSHALSLPRECAGYGWNHDCTRYTQQRKLPLCNNCHVKALGAWGDSKHFPDWLQFKMNDIRASRRREAREDLVRNPALLKRLRERD